MEEVDDGGEVGHRFRLTEVSIRGQGGSGCQAVTVNPLSLGGVTTEPKHLKDGTA